MHLQLYFRAVRHLSDARFASAAAAEFLGFPWYPSSGEGISREDYRDIQQWISGPVPVLQIHARDLALFASAPSKEAYPVQGAASSYGMESDGRHSSMPSDGRAAQVHSQPNDPNSLDATEVVPGAIEVVPGALEVACSDENPQGINTRPTCPIIWTFDARQRRLPELFRADLDYLLLDPSVFLTDLNQQLSPVDLPKSWAGLFEQNRCFLEISSNMHNPMEWVNSFKPYGVGLSGQAETAVGKRDYSAWQEFTDLLEEAGLR